jgi:hypothetical protein
LRRDQAIVGIAGGIAPFRERGLISGLLQLQFHDTLLFSPAFHAPPFCLQCRLDGHRLDHAEKLSGDRRIDPEAAEREAPRQPEHQVGTITPVDGLSRRTARIAHHQAAPATATGQKPSQQRASAAPRLCASYLAVSVNR